MRRRKFQFAEHHRENKGMTITLRYEFSQVNNSCCLLTLTCEYSEKDQVKLGMNYLSLPPLPLPSCC
jgi:hypothetical protein